jgi:hypothetical protein
METFRKQYNLLDALALVQDHVSQKLVFSDFECSASHGDPTSESNSAELGNQSLFERLRQIMLHLNRLHTQEGVLS